MLKQEGESGKPRIRIIKPDGAVEVRINGRLIDFNGEKVNGIWFTEPASPAQEAAAIREARRFGLGLWSFQYVHQLGNRGFVSVTDNDGFGDGEAPLEESADRLLDSLVAVPGTTTKQEIEEDRLGILMTESLSTGGLLEMDPTEIGDILREVYSGQDAQYALPGFVGQNAREFLSDALVRETNSTLPSRLESMNGSISRADMAALIHGSYLLWLSKNY